jgi:hypothetical protein
VVFTFDVPLLIDHLQAINIVKCVEFRRLIRFLWRDLNESDIPHRTKLCELIIVTWHKYFQVLKSDLAVSAYLSRVPSNVLFTLTEGARKNILHV